MGQLYLYPHIFGVFQTLAHSGIKYNEIRIVTKPVGKPKDIQSIVKKHTFPVHVQFPKGRTIMVDGREIHTSHVPDMELLHTFDEMYLLGNIVVDGEQVFVLAVVRVFSFVHTDVFYK